MENSNNNLVKDCKEYNMNYLRRGYAIIINNKHFENGNSDREGSEKDVENIRNALENLDFQVVPYYDRKVKEMTQIMNEYANNKDHTKNDCFVCVIMTHGSRNGSISATDADVYIDDLILPIKKSASLKGKPKLFFIQACRGELEADLKKSNHDSTQIKHKVTETDAVRLKPPNEADIYRHFSTVEGYVSFRDPSSGTWFIKTLSDIINRYGREYSMLQIGVEVNNKVSEYYDRNEKDGKIIFNRQMPMVDHTLRADLYFRSKEYANLSSSSKPNVTNQSVQNHSGDDNDTDDAKRNYPQKIETKKN